MENKQQFPTEEVTLPSKGLLYPSENLLSKGVIEIKYMTAKEEDILTNQNYIQKGTVIDKLLKSLIVTPIDYNDLLVGGKNEFDFTLPFSKNSITFKLLTQADDTKIQNELKGLKKIDKNANPENTTRLKHTILSVDGDSTPKTIREFVDNQLLARDAREFRKYITHVSPDVDLNVDLTFNDGETVENVSLPIGVNFFWPDVEL